MHNIFAALGVFLGASVGAGLAMVVPEEISFAGTTIPVFTPLYGLFLVSCLTRLSVALLFLPLLREVRRVRPMSVSGLIFRVTRMHPVSGVIYELVGRMRRRPDGEDDKRDDV